PHTAPSNLPTPSLHDALPISDAQRELQSAAASITRIPILFPLDRADIPDAERPSLEEAGDAIAKMLTLAPDAGQSLSLTLRGHADRKSTRLNSSHRTISYAVF